MAKNIKKFYAYWPRFSFTKSAGSASVIVEEPSAYSLAEVSTAIHILFRQELAYHLIIKR